MDELKNYSLTSKKGFIRSLVFIYILATIIIALLLAGGSEDNLNPNNLTLGSALLGGAVGAAIVCGLLYYGVIITPQKRFDERIRSLSEEGFLNYVLDDFKNGARKFNGSFILGQHCIITKGNGNIFLYGEISAAYVNFYRVKDKKDGSTKEAAAVMAEVGGHKYMICSTVHSEQTVQDWREISDFLHANAPSIRTTLD